MRITTAGIARRSGTYLLALRRPGSSIGESWEFPGGKVKTGESPEEALKREFHEELGVEVTVGSCLYTTEFSNQGKKYRLMAYEVTLKNFNFQLKEHQKTQWFTIDEILMLPKADSDASVAEHLSAQQLSVK